MLAALIAAPIVFLWKTARRAALWGAWLVLAVVTLISLSAGVLLCVAGNVLTGLIVIVVVMTVEWGLL